MSEQVSTTVARSNAKFAFDVHRLLCQRGGNVFYSPSSIAATLAMAYAGSRGKTAAQIEQVLHLATDPEQTHSGFAALDAIIANIQEQGLVRLDSANSLWPHAEHPLLEEYVSLVRRYYGTNVTPVDYNDGRAAARFINDWVEMHTQGRIKDLVSPDLDPLTRMILVNAIYFRAGWSEPFDEDLTEDDRFWISRWTSVTVPMMRQLTNLRYAKVEGLQVLELPYMGKQLAMLVLLPESRTGLDKVERDLTNAIFNDCYSRLEPTDLDVRLPRFRMDSSFELSSLLKTLGLPEAFDADRADLSGMDAGLGGLYISRVFHKAFVDVEEFGTEAAAATEFELAELGYSPRLRLDKPIVFRADHPFLFAIRERSSGNILFLGRVVNPAD